MMKKLPYDKISDWNNSKFLHKYELLLILFIFSTLFLAVSYIKIENGYYYGDTAIFYDLNHNILERGFPYNSFSSNFAFFIEKGIPTQNASDLCLMNLEPSTNLQTNYLTWHMNLILYPIAIISTIIPIHILWQSLTALSFIGFIIVIYIILRKNDISIINSSLFCLLVIAHPAWNQAILGQIYPDRLFLFFCILFIYFFTQKNPNYPLIFFSGILTLLIHERSGIILGFFILGYIALYWKRIESNKERIIKIFFGIISIIYSIVIIKLFINNLYYNTYFPSSLTGLIQNFSNQPFFEKTLLFILFNLIIFGIFAIFEWRAFLISIPILSLNIIGNVGGAEKTGWVTHYHSYYFPILIWAALLGYIHLTKIFAQKGRQITFIIIIITLIILTSAINPDSYERLDLSAKNIGNNGLLTTLYKIPDTINGNIPPGLKYSDEMKRLIPENSTVTSTEGIWPVLYENRQLYLFPIGIDSADYAVLVIKGKNGSEYVLGGMVSYLGQKTADECDKCLIERMKTHGYDFNNATINEPAGVGIIKRMS